MTKEYGAKDVYDLHIYDENSMSLLFHLDTNIKYEFGLGEDSGYFVFTSCLLLIDLLNKVAVGGFTDKKLRLVAISKVRSAETGKDFDSRIIIDNAVLNNISVKGSNDELADTVIHFHFDTKDSKGHPNFNFEVDTYKWFDK